MATTTPKVPAEGATRAERTIARWADQLSAAGAEVDVTVTDDPTGGPFPPRRTVRLAATGAFKHKIAITLSTLWARPNTSRYGYGANFFSYGVREIKKRSSVVFAINSMIDTLDRQRALADRARTLLELDGSHPHAYALSVAADNHAVDRPEWDFRDNAQAAYALGVWEGLVNSDKEGVYTPVRLLSGRIVNLADARIDRVRLNKSEPTQPAEPGVVELVEVAGPTDQ